MIQLARIFGNNMILQRNVPVLFWGVNDGGDIGNVSLKLNGEELDTIVIPAGEFSFYFPEQEAMENVEISIGDITFSNVDFGEIWIAGGQSNMEYALEYDRDAEGAIAEADDEHFRMYTVGQYSYAGQREEGYKAWNPWDEWLDFKPENAGRMSAIGVYFAKELRKQGVPVGIVSCNWGGTSASSWMSRECMLADPQVSAYVTEYDEMVSKLDMNRYNMIKAMIRPSMSTPASRKMDGFIMTHTMKPEEMMKAVMEMSTQQQSSQEDENEPPEIKQAKEFMKGVSQEEMMMPGPGDEHEPAALYENMLKEIIGFSNRGVLWYQGESDESKADIYDKTFTLMIDFWREQWREKNAYQERMPFLFVQLAPFGTWMGNLPDHYPTLRQKQEVVAENVKDVYMASNSDLGNIYDIHPKIKGPLGFRLYLLAERYVYGKAILADAPRAAFMEQVDDCIRIHFDNAQGLHGIAASFEEYNGFALADMPKEYIPPVLGPVNGLEVILDGEKLENAECGIVNEALEIYSPKIRNTKKIEVNFAKTPFYEVNIFNMAEIPVMPFTLKN